MRRIAIIVSCCLLLWGLCGCRRAEEASAVPEGMGEAGYRRTTLYYASDDGFVVPVMKSIPWEEGIGRAALGYLVAGEDNDRSAATMGLKTVIPEGTDMTLRISEEGVATVDMLGLGALGSQAEEQAMVVAIVNTLSEFGSIDRVQLRLDGQEAAALPHGTDISKPMGAFALNVEDGAAPVSTGGAHRLTLYFPNASASLNVPVTRYVEGEPSFATAMAQMVKGTEDGRLRCCIPEGTGLNSAYISDGIATVDFTGEFAATDNVVGALEAVRDCICLTAGQFEEVYGVDIYIDGVEYSMQAQAASAPLYANQFK